MDYRVLDPVVVAVTHIQAGILSGGHTLSGEAKQFLSTGSRAQAKK